MTDRKELLELADRIEALDKPVFGRGGAVYDWPDNGVHLLGFTIDPNDAKGDEQGFSAMSFPMDAVDAKEVFDAARLAGECKDEEQGFIFDLFQNGDHIDDFNTCGQMLPAITAAMRAKAGE